MYICTYLILLSNYFATGKSPYYEHYVIGRFSQHLFEKIDVFLKVNAIILFKSGISTFEPIFNIRMFKIIVLTPGNRTYRKHHSDNFLIT
jgi:hypothetical protein